MTKPIEQQLSVSVKKLRDIRGVEVPRSFSWALNRSAASGKSGTVKSVAKAVSVPQKLVRKRVFVKPSTTKKLVARVRSYYRGISAISLPGIKDTGKGGWKTRRGSGVKARGGWQWWEAFIAKGPKGNEVVFYRTGRIGTGEGRSTKGQEILGAIRIPIKKEVNAFAPKESKRALEERMPKDLAHDLQRRTKKYEV